MDYKDSLEREKGKGRKSKLWKELNDFLLDRLNKDQYLISLQQNMY